MKNIILFIISMFFVILLIAQESRELSIGKPDAIVNLATTEGVNLLKAQWRYSDAKIIEADFRAPGADRKPSGAQIITNDLVPKAGAKDFDDSKWEVIDPTSLDQRRGTGKLSFAWYRINLTVPQKFGTLDAKGSTIILEMVVDDYAEITVNGELTTPFGQSGNYSIKGYNARNRVLLTDNASPGETYQISVLGINGPFSRLPENFIWIRSAALDIYQSYPRNADWENLGEVLKKDAALDNIIASGTKIEKAAEGFQFTEGPVWSPEGYLLFSDPNANTIYSLNKLNNVSVYRVKSGYAGIDIGEYSQPGSNGLAFDPQGRLTICEHGNRRITRIEKNGVVTVLADNYQGKKLNSPNDLVYRSDGALFFTDPPYGLPKFFDDARKELSFSGVYCLKDGKLTLLAKELNGPNGIAFSPDEKYLYVTNWDENKKVVMRYEVLADGNVKNGKVFFDMTTEKGWQALDGLKVDVNGNLFVSGVGGLWVISPSGKHLGTVICPELPANFAWGEDGKTLFMTSRTGVYKMRVLTGGKVAGEPFFAFD